MCAAEHMHKGTTWPDPSASFFFFFLLKLHFTPPSVICNSNRYLAALKHLIFSRPRWA
jgi:hypothetical protein